MAQVDRPLVELVERTLIEARDAHALTPRDPAHDARLIIELVRTMFHHYAFASLDRPIDEITDHLWSFCLRAVGGVPEGNLDG